MAAIIIKILSLCAFSALIAVLWTPFLTKIFYKYKLWRKTPKTKTIDNKTANVLISLQKEKKRNVPRMGGLLIWITTLFVAILFAVLAKFFNFYIFERLNFLSRSQTWLPLGMLVAASLLGLADDLFQIVGKGKYAIEGLKLTRRLLIVAIIGIIGAWWFYSKLGWHTIHIPGNGNFELGILYIPLFVITVIACWSGGIIDGVDGLSGGIFSIMFGAFAIIAFSNSQYDLATFCAVLVGSILSFLWFNIPPARFYMGETGIIGLTTTLAVVAFLTDSLLVLPIIAGPLVITVASVLLQLFSKKIFKKKIFLCAPIHHHFEALGWGSAKVTMRFWIIGIIFAIIGVSIRLLG